MAGYVSFSFYLQKHFSNAEATRTTGLFLRLADGMVCALNVWLIWLFPKYCGFAYCNPFCLRVNFHADVSFSFV